MCAHRPSIRPARVADASGGRGCAGEASKRLDYVAGVASKRLGYVQVKQVNELEVQVKQINGSVVQVKQVNGSVVYVLWNETRFADEAHGGYPGREEVVPPTPIL